MLTVASNDVCAMTSTAAAMEIVAKAVNKMDHLMQRLSHMEGIQVTIVFHEALEVVQSDNPLLDIPIQAVRDRCWEQLHTGHWEEVLIEWRDAYALAQLLWVSHRVRRTENWTGNMMEVDLALMMGGNLFREELEALLQLMTSLSRKRKEPLGKNALTKKHRTESDHSLPLDSLKNSPGRLAYRCETLPSLEEFTRRCCTRDAEPMILGGLAREWPAFFKWRDLEYFHEAFGHRTVPIEIGRHYLAAQWGQKMMTMSDFLTLHICAEDSDISRGYLAQHPLFDHIPELKADIRVPEYCYLSSESDPVINAWFGPGKTVTPLHYDRSHNILAQIVGRKYIRLYAPEHSAALCPIPNSMNQNSSQIDLDDDEQLRTSTLSGVEFVDLILEPGDGLFIPRGWWHYVRALETSFSVSFWWDRET